MPTFNRQQLAVLSSETGFLRDNLEKVLRLTDILKFIESHPFLDHRLVLKGGTAINLTVFQMPRLSVDIDLDYCNDCCRDEMLEERQQIDSIIVPYMLTQGYSVSPATKSPHSLSSWVFSYINAGGNRDNIKIEINYSMRCHVFPVQKSHIAIPFLQELTVNTLSTLELFGSKIKALIERSACRDLYDVYNMIIGGIIKPEQYDALRKTVLFYLAIGGSHTPLHTYSFQTIQSIQYRHIRASLIPVLRKKERFDFEEAKSIVIQFLDILLRFTPNELQFIDTFIEGQYRPELLFNDPNIIERIKNHPMAIWKTRQSDSLHP